MARKPPRRTAERILETALDLFNRFGEPNVSTTVIATQLGISAGNLYYHYQAKEDIVNSLSGQYVACINALLPAGREVRDVEAAWFFLHSLFEGLWEYRFLYRDLNELLSRNRILETCFQQLTGNTVQALREMLAALHQSGAARIDSDEIKATATSMVVVLSYWLSFEFVRDPRHALEAEAAAQALARGVRHVLQLLAPFLEPDQRRHLLRLVQPDDGPAAAA